MSGNEGTVLITGAVGGMGSASARRLAAEHPRFVLTDKDAPRLERLAKELRKLGAECRVAIADLDDPESIDALVETVAAEGGLRALVHTAAVSPSMADWRLLLRVDLTATIRLLDGLLPLTNPGAAAVCFASIAAHMGRHFPAGVLDALADPRRDDLLERIAAAAPAEPTTGDAYIWAKTAIVRLCEELAVPWGARGARIVSLSPGLIDTPMGRLELAENPAKRPMMSVTPLRRPPAEGQSELPGRCDDIAEAVAFLCSDRASFVSGCDLRVDGGFIGALRRAEA